MFPVAIEKNTRFSEANFNRSSSFRRVFSTKSKQIGIETNIEYDANDISKDFKCGKDENIDSPARRKSHILKKMGNSVRKLKADNGWKSKQIGIEADIEKDVTDISKDLKCGKDENIGSPVRRKSQILKSMGNSVRNLKTDNGWKSKQIGIEADIEKDVTYGFKDLTCSKDEIIDSPVRRHSNILNKMGNSLRNLKSDNGWSKSFRRPPLSNTQHHERSFRKQNNLGEDSSPIPKQELNSSFKHHDIHVDFTDSTFDFNSPRKQSKKSFEFKDPYVFFLELLDGQDPCLQLLSHSECMERKQALEKISTLIKEHPHFCELKFKLKAFNGQEVYPLHMLCALSAPLTIIKRCIAANKAALQDSSSEIGTALHYACYYGNSIESIQYLMMKGPTCLVRLNAAGRTPFMMSCMNRNTKINCDLVSFLALLQFADIDRSDARGNTPMHLACRVNTTKSSLQLMECIKRELPDKTNFASNKDGQTPLHIALENPKADLNVVKILISPRSVSPYVTDKKGRVPLHVAVSVYGGQPECERAIRYIAKKFPQTLEVKDANGQTPFDLAQEMGLGNHILKLLEN